MGLNLKSWHFYFALFTLASCAQVVAPTGGDKDIIPPEILTANPPSGQLNFEQKKIEFQFNEFVKLLKFKEELIVSPPLKHPITTKIKGKSLILEIEDTLKENTTYIFNFGNSIVDITENNPIKDFTYVFSTGDIIDTLSLSGRVTNAFDSKVEEGVLVMLYEENEDSIPYLNLPTYLARTNEEGIYTINNIKEGEYKIFALKDENKNYLFDRSDEPIAFDTNLITIQQSNEDVNLRLFIEDHEKQFVKQQNEDGPFLEIVMNRTFDQLEYDLLDTSLTEFLLFKHVGINKDTAQFYFKELEKERLKFDLKTDTNFRDTLSILVDCLNENFSVDLTTKHPHFEHYKIRANWPIDSIRKDSISLYRKSDSSIVPYTLQLSGDGKMLRILSEWEENEQYKIVLLPKSLHDIYGRYNDSIEWSFKTTEEKEFGNLHLKIEFETTHNLVVQLLNGGGKFLKEASLDSTFTGFMHLKAGDYRLKLIEDMNGDDKWTTGNYIERKAPERTVIYNEPITIRANWDQEILWKIE